MTKFLSNSLIALAIVLSFISAVNIYFIILNKENPKFIFITIGIYLIAEYLIFDLLKYLNKRGKYK